MKISMTALLLDLALGSPVERADDSTSKEQIWEGTLEGPSGGRAPPDRARDVDKGGGELTAVDG